MSRHMIKVKGRNNSNITKVLAKVNLFNPSINIRQYKNAKRRLGLGKFDRLILAEDYNCIVVFDKNGNEIDIIP